MISPDEKNNDAISTSGSLLLDLEVNSNISYLSKKHNYKKKNKNKPIFKVKIVKNYYKNIKNSNNFRKKGNNLFLLDFEIPNFLQDKIEIKKISNEINNYENKIKNYSNEEKEIFITTKEKFINSIINKYNLPLFISKSNFNDIKEEK